MTREDDGDQADPPAGPSSPAPDPAVVRPAGRPASAATTGAAAAGSYGNGTGQLVLIGWRLVRRAGVVGIRRVGIELPAGPRRGGAARLVIVRSSRSRSGSSSGPDRGRQRSPDAQDPGLRRVRRPRACAAPPGNRRTGRASGAESTRRAGSGPVEPLDGPAEAGEDGLGELVRAHRGRPRRLEPERRADGQRRPPRPGRVVRRGDQAEPHLEPARRPRGSARTGRR